MHEEMRNTTYAHPAPLLRYSQRTSDVATFTIVAMGHV